MLIRISDLPCIQVNLTKEGCSLSLPESSGFYCFSDLYSHQSQTKASPKSTSQFVIEGNIPHLIEYLNQYAKKRECVFPFIPRGSAFDEQIWSMIANIPFGWTQYYSTLLGASFARSVGGSCKRNPMPLFIPCHRVIAANGTIGGYAFDLEVKRRLLQFEDRGQKRAFLPQDITAPT